MERLLKGEEVRREVAVNIVYPQIRTRPDVAWSFLLHGGYLKADERQQVHTSITHRLSIPNLEVTVVYEKVIRDWLEGGCGGGRILSFLYPRHQGRGRDPDSGWSWGDSPGPLPASTIPPLRAKKKKKSERRASTTDWYWECWPT